MECGGRLQAARRDGVNLVLFHLGNPDSGLFLPGGQAHLPNSREKEGQAAYRLRAGQGSREGWKALDAALSPRRRIRFDIRFLLTISRSFSNSQRIDAKNKRLHGMPGRRSACAIGRRAPDQAPPGGSVRRGISWEKSMPPSINAQPKRARIPSVSPSMIQPARAANTDSRLRMMAAWVGLASR